MKAAWKDDQMAATKANLRVARKDCRTVATKENQTVVQRALRWAGPRVAWKAERMVHQWAESWVYPLVGT